MKFSTSTAIFALTGLVAAELPQEHSHEKFMRSVNTLLQENNPLQIKDTVFGLLGNAAAAKATDQVTGDDLDCLQQIIADQAFTNAKAKSDVQGMVDALTYRVLEKNSGSVGLASKACTTVKATNPEIAALKQVQDPASEQGKAENKQTILDLAVQIAAVGGDPLDANLAGTFAPGQIGDPTAKGNTCDDADDAEGCIFTQNLLVQTATAQEIQDAVAAAGNGGNNNGTVDNGNNNNNNGTVDNVNNNNNGTDVCNGNAGNAGNAAGGSTANIQSFTGALGGAAPAVAFDSTTDRAFSVNGNSFTTAKAALTRSCDIQNNACFNAANGGQLTGGTSQCSQQQQDCIASIAQSESAVSKAKRSLKLGGRRLSK